MNHDNNKTTPDRIFTNAFRTPVDPKSPKWSPIFHATTPDLNAPGTGCKGTPALMQSLGINPELDVSWSTVMETPPNPALSITGIIKLEAPKRIEDKPKPLQPCTLFLKQEGNMQMVNDANNSTKIMQQPNFSGKTLNSEKEKKNSEVKANDLLNCWKKPSSKFIYPEPVYINISHQSHITNPIEHVKQQQTGVEREFTPKAIVKSQLQKNVKEIRKSLNFSNDCSMKGHDSISYSTSRNSAPLEKEADDDAVTLTISNAEVSSPCHSRSTISSFGNQLDGHFFLKKDDIETVIQPRVKAETSSVRQQCCDSIASPVTSKLVGCNTAKKNIATASEKATNLSRLELEKFEKEDEISLRSRSSTPHFNITIEAEVPEKAWNCDKMAGFNNLESKDGLAYREVRAQYKLDLVSGASSSAMTEYPKLTGFSTAGGNKLIVSETAMFRARANLEEINNGDFTPSNKPNNSSHIGIQEKNCKLDEALFSNSNDATATIGSSGAKTKSTACFEEAINRGRSRFSGINEATPPHAALYPKTVGFSTAGGKKVAISEKAIAQAKCLFSEFEDCVAQSTDIPQAAGFSMASGKKVTVSKEAIARGQALLNDVFGTNVAEENSTDPQSKLCSSSDVIEKSATISKQISVTPVNSKLPAKTSFKPPKKLVPAHTPAFQLVEINHTIPLQVPLNVGFNTASGKEEKISESSLCRARKTFEEISLVEGIRSAIEDKEQAVEPNSSPPLSAKNDNADNKTKMVDKKDCDDYWVSSPTIGKKTKRAKRVKNLNDSPQKQQSRTPISGTSSAFESSAVSAKVRALRRIAREEQMSLIKRKQLKSQKSSPKAGYLYRLKTEGVVPKKTWRELVGNGSLPELLPPYKLLEDHGILTSVCLVQASNASSFNFCAWDHFPIDDCLENSKGMQIGKFLVIFSDENTIGCEEIGASLLASENVDPHLISNEWIRNHYHWIVWKLASMELRMPSLFARTGLTLFNVLEQLKYRYDREIDHCQRSVLRRIIEQDDIAAKTMILCVAEIRTPTVVELTDGWYSIEAHCDSAMQQLIEKNKIFLGVKLIISGAELVSPGPVAPLEKGSDTYLKISANSTRRARWDSKLGVCSKPLPFPIALSSILPDGGVVSHIRVHIIRVYPLTYMEKAPDGKTVFRGERQYRRITESAAVRYERMMEKVVEDIEREEDEQERKRLRADGNHRRNKEINLTDEEKRCRILTEAQKRMQMNMKSIEGVPMLKLRVVDNRATNSNSAMVSIWRPSEELQHHLKEERAYRLYNVNAAGLRFGELQLSAMKNTLWSELNQSIPKPLLQSLARSVTPFSTANQLGFKPMFNELDIVGLVVHVGQQQSKGPFQTAILSDGATYFGVKCWVSLEDYALADIIVVGAFLAFSNLQWRATACRTASKLQFAFIHEGTLVSSRPALKHLDAALHGLKHSVKDPGGCINEAEGQVDVLLGSATPQQSTPRYGNEASGRGAMFTPTGVANPADGKKNETPTSSNLTITRARLLEKYPDPPALTPWNGCASPLVRQKFKPPARKPPVN